MAFTEKDLYYLYKSGKMPQWVYFQLNGKNAQENYNTLLLERQNEIMTMKSLKKDINKNLEKTVYNALAEILKGVN